MRRLDKKNAVRLIGFIIFIVVAIIVTAVMIPFIENISTQEGRGEIKQFVAENFVIGVVLFLGLQVIQIVIAIIPGEPIEIIGGILFGMWGGFFLCMVGILAGTVIIFYLVKSFGYPLLTALFSEEKISNIKLFNNQKRVEVLVFVLFLIPGTPKDILTYIVPLTKIKPSTFFILSTVARIPSVASSTLVGASIGEGKWAMSIVIFSLTAIIGLVGIFFNDKFVKHIKRKR
jgi:uncharacterized membrane protein YdjX (TVP38/TMEM64 family)